MEQSIPSHTLLYRLINFLPDQCSTVPAIPGGGFPPVRGLQDYESPARLAGPILPKLGFHRHPGITRLPSTSACRIFPNRSLCTFTHNRVLTNMSGLSPYCCSMCPGFHRAAVLFLSELYTNRDPHGSP